MRPLKIPTVHFANFLQRLEDHSKDESSKNKKDADESSVFDFLQSHPATKARIDAVKEFDAQKQK